MGKGQGKLAGFDEIIVSGHIYDVRFIDGSFLGIFGDQNGIDFPSRISSRIAAHALASAYALYPTYANTPELTTGCTNIHGCDIITPYGVSRIDDPPGPESDLIFNSSTWISDTREPGPITIRQLTAGDDTSTVMNYVYADWTVVTQVPVPAAIWLMSTAMLGLFGVSRRKVQ